MNRRQLLQGAAASVVALSSSRLASTLSLFSPPACQINPPSPSDMRILFRGLWAFRYGQLNPRDNKTEGILAFSPDFNEHSYVAYLKNDPWPSRHQLAPGVAYSMILDGCFPQKKDDLWRLVQQHDAGLFLHVTPTAPGSVVVNPPKPSEIQLKKARTVWLPYPDDIFPVATIDLQQKLFDENSPDLNSVDLKHRWPMIQCFTYSNSTTMELNDGTQKIVAGSVNLHLMVFPTTPVSHDGGEHARKAWNALVGLIPKDDGKPLGISFASCLPDDMGVCSASFPGIDDDDLIPPSCSGAHTTSPQPCSDAHSASVQKGTHKHKSVDKSGGKSRDKSGHKMTVPYPLTGHFPFDNPSNCAAGTGVQIDG